MNPNDRGVGTPTRPEPKQNPTRKSAPAPAQTPLQNVPMGFWILMAVTVILLAAMLVTMTVLLITDGMNREDVYFDQTTGGSLSTGDGGTKKPSATTATNVKQTKPKPSNPSRDSYAIANADSMSEITNIQSGAAVLVDLDSYSAVAVKNADTRIYPASMTKVMTLLVACEELAKNSNEVYLETLLTVTQAQITYQSQMGASGIMGFKPGEQASVENMLYLINYNSDTIACLAVADALCGSEANFVSRMNEKARALGLVDTSFTNVTGLHNENHYTTCREMAAIMAAALDNELARKIITSFNGREIPILMNGAQTRCPTVYAAWYSDRLNDNPNLTTSVVKGGKTGYEDIPTACFVTYAEGKSGGKYVCVTVGRTNAADPKITNSQSTADTKMIYNTYIY